MTGDIVNSGTIASETSAAILIEDVNFAGTITNSGTLTGATAAVDASAATGGLSFIQTGRLDGAFIGSDFQDSLTFGTGQSTLAASVLGGVDVLVLQDATLDVEGAQTIDGSFTTNGGLTFTLGSDSLAVDGDVTLGADSSVTVSSPDDITGLALGESITVLSQTGSFTDNGAVVTVTDTAFLVDFQLSPSALAVTPVAADLTGVSADANLSAFGGAVTEAFSAGALGAEAVALLNGVSGAAEFESVSLELLPAIYEGVTREIFETQSLSNAFVDRRVQGEGTGVWGQALYRTANRDAESLSVTGYDADAFGFTIGADRAFSEAFTAGLAFSYADIDIDEDGAQPENAEIDSYQISGYADFNAGAFFATGLVGYSFNNVDTDRTTALGGVTGSFDVDGINAQTTIGYDLIPGEARFTPLIGLHYANLSSDSYTETGGLGLEIDGEDVSFLDLRAGFEAALNRQGETWSVQPLLRAAFVYDAIADERAFDIGLSGAAPFRLTSTEPAEARAEFGAGLRLAHQSGFSLNLEYDGELADNYTAHGLFLRAEFRF